MHSSTGSPRSLDDASPVGQLPPSAQGGPVGNAHVQGNWSKNSGFSLGGVSEDVSGLQSENEEETVTTNVSAMGQDGSEKDK